MKLAALGMTLSTLWSAAAFAADASTAAAPVVPLRGAVAFMESRYHGEVVAAALDASGDKATHYHVDMRYPDSGIARLELDARTLDIASREQPRPSAGWTTLPGAAAAAAAQLDGQVLTAELDSVDGASPHYDVDVRLQGGEIARLKIDPRTQRMAWRTPPVLVE